MNVCSNVHQGVTSIRLHYVTTQNVILLTIVHKFQARILQMHVSVIILTQLESNIIFFDVGNN